jgi:hypothetical protein
MKINKNYQINRDQHCWTLQTTRKGKPTKKHSNPSDQVTQTYYANLEQCVRAIVDRAAGECDNLEELYQMLEDARKGILTAIK